MAVQALPILVVGGAALLLSGGKKKKSSKSGKKCDPDERPPKGFLCDGGYLREETVDEGDLDDLSKDEMGEFDIEEEDVGFGDDEELSTEEEPHVPEPEEDAEKRCEEFMAAIHDPSQSPDDLPINSIAVEESVIPAMATMAGTIAAQHGQLDPERDGPKLVLEALRALIPVCEWKYNEAEDEFTYEGGRQISSKVAQDVLFGLIQISLKVIQDTNQPEPQQMNFQPQEG